MSYLDSMERSSLLRNTLLGLIASLLLSGIKFLAGVVGHSSALVADAVESFADAIGSLLVWQALRVASRPADEKHPYGYGKAEAVGALAVGCLLVIAAFWIAWESIRTWAGEPSSPEPWTLLVLLLVIGVKELLFRKVAHGAKQEQSSAADADAWHHRADAISSLAALVGVAIAVWGPKWTGKAWLAAADEWAALVAAAIILGTAWSILKPALRELLDADEPDMAEQVRKV
ncbi:MAG: cation diffusion facilitator family transporter, partial [Pirellulaceae bacterium]